MKVILDKLVEFGLDPDNSVVIGSGILDVLGIRQSEDIDVAVNQETYDRLFKDVRLQHKDAFGVVFLVNDEFEIQMSWMHYSFNNLFANSTVIDGVRYNSLEFLLKIKKEWTAGDSPRQKDINDVKLIEDYLKAKSEKP